MEQTAPPQLHQLVVKAQKSITVLLKVIIWGVILTGILGSVALINQWLPRFLFINLAGPIGILALSFYILSLLPGILKRFNIFPLIRSSLMLFRREFGVMMFWLVVVHMLWAITLPMLMSGVLSFSSLSNQVIFGLIAWFLLIPLWLTSNDKSQKTLKKRWRTIHSLTHVIVWLVMLHVAMVMGKSAILAILIVMLDAASFVVNWMRPDSSPSLVQKLGNKQ